MFNRQTTNAALVSDQRYRDQNEHYEQNDALFVFGEFKNSEQALHRNVTKLYLLNLGFLQVVILSEAKNPATSTDFELNSSELLCNILAAKPAAVMIEVAG